MTDLFEGLRRAAMARERAACEWEAEVRAARAAGFSLRTIAEVAGVSHDTVWRLVR